MSNSAVSDSVVDFWIGHSVGDLDKTYKEKDFYRLKALYLEKEKLLSIAQRSLDVEELEKKVDARVDEKIQNLQGIITNYAAESIELKAQMQELSGFRH
ncbi:MAG: hypothetical protein NWF14_02435 [Candidatus Bathyarchaeota archaeon]|nr:hypothetical protein [Candidatus Bathyarchaeota archaeon]